MAAKPEGFFTNTNLMIAGIICAIIGAGLAFVYINRRVDDATGKPVKIAFAKKDIRVNDLCKEELIRWVELPERFVDEAGGKFVKEDTLSIVRNHSPSRLIEADEPLLSSEFSTGGGEAPTPPPPSGMVLITVGVSQKSQPGEALNIGSIISLIGNFDFSPDKRTDPHTLTLFDRVKVVEINGKANPSKSERHAVQTVGIFVGEANARIRSKLETSQTGEGRFDIEILGPNTLMADIRDQIPEETVKTIKEAEDQISKGKNKKDKTEEKP
jgi:hypothetical protein